MLRSVPDTLNCFSFSRFWAWAAPVAGDASSTAPRTAPAILLDDLIVTSFALRVAKLSVAGRGLPGGAITGGTPPAKGLAPLLRTVRL
jgi:hypothetical protein